MFCAAKNALASSCVIAVPDRTLMRSPDHTAFAILRSANFCVNASAVFIATSDFMAEKRGVRSTMPLTFEVVPFVSSLSQEMSESSTLSSPMLLSVERTVLGSTFV